jgi:hypothetical protein
MRRGTGRFPQAGRAPSRGHVTCGRCSAGPVWCAAVRRGCRCGPGRRGLTWCEEIVSLGKDTRSTTSTRTPRPLPRSPRAVWRPSPSNRSPRRSVPRRAASTGTSPNRQALLQAALARWEEQTTTAVIKRGHRAWSASGLRTCRRSHRQPNEACADVVAADPWQASSPSSQHVVIALLAVGLRPWPASGAPRDRTYLPRNVNGDWRREPFSRQARGSRRPQ